MCQCGMKCGLVYVITLIAQQRAEWSGFYSFPCLSILETHLLCHLDYQ